MNMFSLLSSFLCTVIIIRSAPADTVAKFTRSADSSHITTGARITTTAFTVEMWLNPTSIESGDNVVFAQDIGGDKGRFNIVPRGNGTLFAQVGDNNFAPSCSLAAGEWTHIAFVRNERGEARLWVNGAPLTNWTLFNTNALAASDIVLGRQHRNKGTGFNGLMSDVRVWSVARGEDEIVADMGRRLGGRETGLVSYFRLDEGGENPPRDAVRAVDGAFVNGACWAHDATFPNRMARIVDARKECALEKAVAERIADLALVPPRINTNPLPDYDYDRLDYAMNNGIAMTPGGRIYASWVAGGDSPAAFFVCNYSDDCGETWSKPCFVINMHSDRLPLNRSTIVGNLWTDPKGRLWFFFSQSMEHCDGRAGSWCAVCDNPDAAEPKWSASRRLFHGYSLNKPLVLKNGTWLLGVELPSALGYFARVNAFDSLNAYRGANVMRSTDEGRSWEWLSCMKFPRPDWDEHILLERDDGRIWMVARTGAGLRQTFSSDGGKTWDAPTATNINHPVARFQILRLASGRLLLVKHGPSVGETDGVRHDLKAFLSNDDGATWVGGLMLDERNSVSYPDGFQAPDGRIYISYDHNRGSDAEICMARFTEADVLAGSLVTATSRLKILVSKGTAKNR